jgi:AAA domain
VARRNKASIADGDRVPAKSGVSPFRKAKAEQAALKIGLYGPPGSGKTFTALLCAEGLAKRTAKRIAYVDTERGTDFYCQAVPERKIHPEAFDFDALYTRSITELQSSLYTVSPERYSVIVIDSITHFWEAAREAYSGDLTKVGTIPFHAWAKIKKPYKQIMNFLLNSPVHVFILGRQGNVFEEDEESGEIKQIGVKMKAEGETPYEPHILLRMEAERHKGGQSVITAFGEKDRTGILQGRIFRNPGFNEIIKPLIGLLGDKQATVEDADQTAAKDSEILSEKEIEKERKGAEILGKLSAKITLCEDLDQLKQIGAEITSEVKRRMSTNQVTELRNKYQEAERRLKPAESRKDEEPEGLLDLDKIAAEGAAGNR